MHLFLLGASGLVGAACARAAAGRGHRVTGIVGRFTGNVPGVATQLSWDLGALSEFTRLVAQVKPEAIINCAAASEPAACDADPAGTARLNVDLPAALARLSAALGARLVHVSSEQVFSGNAAPYRIDDPVSPLTRYGRQKAASEREVLAAAPAHAAVVRAPLLMGNSPRGQRSVHERLLADWAAGRAPRLFTDEIRQVAHADDLAEVLVRLAERPDLRGIFHWAGAEATSRFALGERIRRRFHLDPQRAPVVAARRADDPVTRDQRPADLRLDLEPLPGALGVQPQSLDEQLRQLVVPPTLSPWVEQAAADGAGGTPERI